MKKAALSFSRFRSAPLPRKRLPGDTPALVLPVAPLLFSARQTHPAERHSCLADPELQLLRLQTQVVTRNLRCRSGNAALRLPILIDPFRKKKWRYLIFLACPLHFRMESSSCMRKVEWEEG